MSDQPTSQPQSPTPGTDPNAPGNPPAQNPDVDPTAPPVPDQPPTEGSTDAGVPPDATDVPANGDVIGGDDVPPADVPAPEEPAGDVPTGPDGDPLPDRFMVNLNGTGANGAFTIDDLERLSHNQNMDGYASWSEGAQWHARRQERILHTYLMDTYVNLGGEEHDADPQAQQAIRSAIESGLHALAAIEAGAFSNQVNYTEAP
jgi:hypothetical protein